MRRYVVTYVEYDEQTDKTLEMLEALEKGEIEPAEPSYKVIYAKTEKEAWIKFNEWSNTIDWYTDILFIEDEGKVDEIGRPMRKEN